MKILSIETSCDETAIAILEIERNDDGSMHYTVLGNSLLSQAKDHARYGGVFPNLAKREHGRNLTPVLMEALRQSHSLEGKTGQVPEEEIMALKEMLAREGVTDPNLQHS